MRTTVVAKKAHDQTNGSATMADPSKKVPLSILQRVYPSTSLPGLTTKGSNAVFMNFIEPCPSGSSSFKDFCTMPTLLGQVTSREQALRTTIVAPNGADQERFNLEYREVEYSQGKYNITLVDGIAENSFQACALDRDSCSAHPEQAIGHSSVEKRSVIKRMPRVHASIGQVDFSAGNKRRPK